MGVQHVAGKPFSDGFADDSDLGPCGRRTKPQEKWQRRGKSNERCTFNRRILITFFTIAPWVVLLSSSPTSPSPGHREFKPAVMRSTRREMGQLGRFTRKRDRQFPSQRVSSLSKERMFSSHKQLRPSRRQLWPRPARRVVEKRLRQTKATRRSGEARTSHQSLNRKPSRFHIPQRIFPYIRTLTLAQSGHRVLYSSIARKSVDGLGHAMATFNAEVSIALELGLTYTHRIASFGELTDSSPTAVDDFFGWGDGEVRRSEIQKNICNMDPEMYDDSPSASKDKNRVCQTCNGLQPLPHSNTRVSVKWISYIHEGATYPARPRPPQCGAEDDYLDCLHSMRAKMPKNVLYVLTDHGCDRLAPNSQYKNTRPWFYWKYWERHGLRENGEVFKGSPFPRRDRSIPFNDSELVIAIHARRGDFVGNSPAGNRRPTSSAAFINAVLLVLSVVRRAGSMTAQMPVAVHIYAEGTLDLSKKIDGKTIEAHDVSYMTKKFVDIDGREQNAGWFENRILDHLKDLDVPLKADVRVKMHISQDTIKTLHEMIAADIFIGSVSGMSTSIVGSLGRGVLLQGNNCDLHRPSTTCYDVATGAFDVERFEKHFTAYSKSIRQYM